MWHILKQIVRTGIVTEPAPDVDEAGQASVQRIHQDILDILGQALTIRVVDAGSCNGCELEIASAFGPVYDAERYGARLVTSPRHADVVLVTGVVTRNMAAPLCRTVEATPQPRVVVAVGDCALDCGVFAGGYGVAGSVADFVPVDLSVPQSYAGNDL